ncbi:MAG TPA: cellulose synthase catalytic subunit [Methanothrix sp.]|nr:cellulose synthase catalytic subunit [Methanothrix sp.]
MTIVVIGTITTIIYLIMYTFILFYYDYNMIDRLFSFLLFPSILFFAANSLEYSLCVFRENFYCVNKSKETHSVDPISPKVAVFIMDFNEDRVTLERTISSCTQMSYRNRVIYLLDDSTNDELMISAQDIAERYEIEYLHRDNRIGYKAGAINEALRKVKAKYVLLLDADQRPYHNILSEVVPMLEEDPKLAFVQTPQFYSNHATNRVAGAAFANQASFFNYICEGKSRVNAIFTSGTNVVIRVSALQDIGGFDEESVTEDLSTSFDLHKNGYSSYYHNHILAEGNGPLDFPGFKKQQMRWAYGGIRVLRKVVWSFIKYRSSLTITQWQEYFLTSTWYFIGLATFLLMLSPVAFLLFDIHSLSMKQQGSYLIGYLLYLTFSYLQLFTTLKLRGVKTSEILWGLNISFIAFPTYMKAAFYALIGKELPFVVTPKTSSGRASIKEFLPQIAMMIVMAFTVAVGIIKIWDHTSISLVINTLWSLYCLTMLQGIWYFMPVGRRDVSAHQ